MNRFLLIAALLCTAAQAQPFLPGRDDQVIERLPYKAADPVMGELRADRSRLREEPDNLRLALRVARRYSELGRVNGDPRYAGYAQAALMPWWTLQRPPNEVLLMRATLRQRMHEFDAAVADLDVLVRSDPWNAQARLTRATVLQVQGRYSDAAEDCRALQRLAGELVATTCLAGVESVTGHLHDSYRQLRLALERHPEADASIRSWVLTALAEMAVHADATVEAESQFSQALSLDSEDFYLLGAYTDFLLEQHRPAEVVELLANKTSADPLLLRYTLALEAAGSAELPTAVRQLRDRFEASRLRGDRVHLREEARFTLHVLHDAPRALQLAKENWEIQKEVADVRVLLEAALACRNAMAVAALNDWLRASRLEDAHIQRLMHPAVHPDPGAVRTSQRS